MTRALFAASLLLLPCAASACGADLPRVVVSVTGEGGDDLVRLRLLVRECGENRFALLRDFDTSLPAPADPFDAAVVPGRIFYVWIQAWESCTLTGPCPDENSSPAGTCLCVEDGDPPAQKLTHEACSRWLRASEGVTEVPLRLAPVRGSCPPEALESCDELE
jgi:hypothetical protein